MELTDLTIVQQAALIGAGEVSARQLVSAHVERSERLQPLLNAFVVIDRDQALLRAEMIDRRKHRALPLTGIPIAIKDLIDQRGLPTTAGSSFYNAVPAKTAPVLRRLEEAGAVIIGRTVLHEFAFGFSSENPWTGPVRNPWDLELSTGGSSGGSAAAVAARMASGAVGTDTGGSVRVPAAVCGVTGLKVTYGRIPLEGVMPLAPTLDTVGPLARTVSDTALLYNVMASISGGAPGSLLMPGPVELSGLRVGVPRPWVDRPLDPLIKKAFDSLIDYLVEKGVVVVDVDEPMLQPSEMIVFSSYPEIARVHATWFPARHHEYGADVQERLREALLLTVEEATRGQLWRRELQQRMVSIFEDVDVLVTPTVAAARKTIGNDEVVVGSETEFYRTSFSAFTSLVNQAGNPALSLPLAIEGNPPPSVQLIGPHYGENRLLEIGITMEADGFAGYQSPPL
ncbi:MAG: amidase [Acidimicrobiia bacterium]|nr:amidase [Acidimicrobiia bacterium]